MEDKLNAPVHMIPVGDNLDESMGHLTPRPMQPAPIQPPKQEIKIGDDIGKKTKSTVVLCWECEKPVYRIDIVRSKSPILTKAKPLGNWRVPDNSDSQCPICKSAYRYWDGKVQRFKYRTDRGIM